MARGERIGNKTMQDDHETLRTWRLASQHISDPPRQSPPATVAWFSGVQAQNYAGGKWFVGMREQGGSESVVDQAIQQGEILRTWALRGTLHFVAAPDLSWLLALLAPEIIRRNTRRYRQLELDEANFTQSRQVIQFALQADGVQTRAQLKARLEQAGVPVQGQQFAYLLQRAALERQICFGAPRGSAQTFALVDDWIDTTPRAVDPAEAPGMLAARYFASHGPATRQDFAWWAGLTAQEARLAIESAPRVEAIELGDVSFWAVGNPPTAGVTQSAALLQPFDEYLLGYRDRTFAVDAKYATLVNAGGGILKPTMIVGGQVLGIWSYTVKKQTAILSLQPFQRLSSDEHDLILTAVERFSRYLSMPAEAHFERGQSD